jgi:hypothetical protein
MMSGRTKQRCRSDFARLLRVLHHDLPRSYSDNRSSLNEVSATNDDDIVASIRSLRPPDDVANPVLSIDDVPHCEAGGFVADPFLHRGEDRWHLFAEVYDAQEGAANIGHATSVDGAIWEYHGIVLDEDAHVAFPYVFEYQHTHYMVPSFEGKRSSEAVMMYEAVEFPRHWEPRWEIVNPPGPLFDIVVFRWEGIWWAIGSEGDNATLRAYHSERLTSEHWTPHEDNPVLSGRPSAGRPAGRPLIRDGRLVLPLQDCYKQYGDALRLYEVTELTPSSYSDEPLLSVPLLRGTGRVGWCSGRSHHIDIQPAPGGGFLAVLDGDIRGPGTELFGSQWSVGVLAGD